MSSRPLKTDGRMREMSKGEASQQDEDEKTVHCQVLLALFISLKGWPTVKPTAPGEDRRNKTKKIKERVGSV